MGMQVSIVTVEKSMEISQKSKNYNNNPAILLLVYVPQGKNSLSKRYLHPIYCSTPHNSQDLQST